ncbi:MAG: DNA repair protein RecN [Niabella sp.]
MLQHLYISNYAIIDELEINFSNGMNVITGETGAGKSIIIGALNLILGERADTSALVNKEKKCIIEGVFAAGSKPLVNTFLESNDLDELPEITVRREIATNGKSRAFINDTPVTLPQLQSLGGLLVDLHRQFDTLHLSDAYFQVNVLDALAGNQSLLLDYRKAFAEWQEVNKSLTVLKQKQQDFEKERDYNQFQYDELNEAAFRENELEAIDEELKMLSHAEGLRAALSRAFGELEEGEQPIVQQLKSLVNFLGNYQEYHKSLLGLVERLRSAQVELQDIADEVEIVNRQVNYDPQKIEQLNERLALGYRLQKKHGVNSTAALLEVQQTLEEKLQQALHIGDEIEAAEAKSALLLREAKTLAKKISEKREKQIKPLALNVNKLLAQVGMPNASLRVSLAEKTLSVNGADEVAFLFDANKSGQFKPVGKVASGGELSRLMLCVKSLVAQRMDMPTLIFDEIDTGISGEAARQVGIIMRGLAHSRQVICITHQPQIAGKADAHYFVYKQEKGGQVVTGIRSLSKDERVNVIAQMLGGENPSAAALENAREMVEH